MNSSLWLENHQLAEKTLQALKQRGVRDLVICPGARNSPWIEILSSPSCSFGFELFYHFDERSASFFALGRARSSGAPCAVLTTSGTAVGELLPACMEAQYTGTPLILVTADRPRRFRGTGAPQSCEQKEIFGIYCQSSIDMDGLSAASGELFSSELITGPIHWNICFEEPKNERPPHLTEPSLPNIEQSQFPLVIVGELQPQECSAVRDALKNWGYPVITEALSQLSNEPSLESLRITTHSRLWNEAHSSQYPIDGVIRIGGVPTLRFWRDLEVHPEASRIPVLSIHSLPFSGLPRAELKVVPLQSVLNLAPPAGPFQSQKAALQWKKENLKVVARKSSLVEQYPASEPGVFLTLSREIASDALVYLGNSLPIREWDLASEPNSRFGNRLIAANRGLNGIDGQLSTFFGMVSEKRSENWAILGDLTTLYDLNAPWLKPASNWHLAVINNQGGRIFDRIFGKPQYTNAHQLNFEGWAKQWGLSYHRVQGAELRASFQGFRTKGQIPRVLEVIPDLATTAQFWAEFERP